MILYRRERSGSVVECLTRDRRAAGSSHTGVTALWSRTRLRSISKPHAYLQAMTKTPVQFLKNRYKTAGGIWPTRYPLAIHIVIDNARKMAQICEKNNKKVI